jgi:hypothetical protein
MKVSRSSKPSLFVVASIFFTLPLRGFCGTPGNAQTKAGKAPAPAPAAAAASQNQSSAQQKDKVVSLYEQNQYQAAAEFFETEAAHSTATVTYYAVLANLRCNRTLRAKQLAHYVLERYPGTTEASLCQAVLRASGEAVDAGKSEAVASDKSGKSGTSEASGTSGKSEKSGGVPAPATSTATSAATGTGTATSTKIIGTGKSNAVAFADTKQPTSARPAERIQYPRQLYTADDIAKVGASGVDQTSNPNCWFESSLAALAMLPRGQRMIAQMITQVDPQTYVVKFPNDGNEYKIDKAELKASKIYDTALWAGLIDCAESKRYPHNQNMESDKNWVETALGCVTGGRVEVVGATSLSPTELSSFIGGAVSSRNPIVCSTKHDNPLPDIVFGGHAYTITEFDPARQMITLRNPHGRYSKSFPRLPDDPQEQHFKQLKGGFSQMDIETFQKYFTTVGRAFI